MGWFRRRAPEGGTRAAWTASEVDDADLETDMTLERTLAERNALIQLCVYALDRTPSAGVAERISEGLGDVGVLTVSPDGERFDPTRHEAGGTIGTDDPALDGVIAETEVPGFADRNRLLRAPVVTVYQFRGG